MKVHLDYGGCHLYSAQDKHFLVCRGVLYIVTREQLIKIHIDFDGKTPQENAEYLIAQVEKETYKKVQL